MSITPINENSEEYNALIELLKDHQSLPVLLATLDAGLRLKTDLKEISNLLKDIFICDEDQFWGKKNGSQYFKKHRKNLNLDTISKFRCSEETFLQFFNFIGEIISSHDLERIYSMYHYNSFKDDSIVNPEKSDETKVKNLPTQLTQNEAERPVDKGLNDESFKAVGEFVKAQFDYENIVRQAVKKNYEDSGMRVLHFLTYLKSSTYYEQNLESLRNFDTYISSFFKFYKNADAGGSRERRIISNKNAIEFIKIIASVAFSRLFSQAQIHFKGRTVAEILDERIEYSLEQNVSKLSTEYVHYLIILANLRTIAPLLDVSIIENKVVTVKECGNELFDFLTDSDDFLYPFLAPSFFQIILDYLVLENFDDPFLNPVIMKGISKGLPYSSFYTEEIKDGLEAIFDLEKADKKFKEVLLNLISENLENWVLPIYYIERFSPFCDYKEFLEDYINQEIITEALKENKDAKNPDCLFPEEFLDLDSFAIPDENDFDWEIETHPALHATSFARNTYISDPKKYILFGRSLMSHGQPYYACLLVSIFFNLRILFELVHQKREVEEKITLPGLGGKDFSSLLEDLQVYKSYDVVEASIKTYLEEGVFSSDNLGFLSAFISQQNEENKQKRKKEKVVEFKIFSSDSTSEKKLDRFCPAARHSFKKCMDLFANEDLTELGLGNYLPITAGNAIEAELKARTTDVDQVSLEEIKRETGLRSSPNAKDTSKFQLGNFVFLLENFSELSPLSKSKMVSLNRMYKDKDFQIFVDAVKNISEARNAVAHVSNFMKAEDVGRTIAVVEELKPNINVCISMLEKTSL